VENLGQHDIGNAFPFRAPKFTKANTRDADLLKEILKRA